MRKVVSVMLTLVVLCAVAGAQEKEENLLPNPSFEKMSGAKLTKWRMSGMKTDAKVSVDKEVAHTGSQSVRIDGAPGARGGVSIAVRGKDVEVGATYKLTAWAKSEGVTKSSLGTCVRLTFAKDRKAVAKAQYLKFGKDAFDWKQGELTFTVPEGTEYYNLVFFHHGEGTAWYDDVSVVKVK